MIRHLLVRFGAGVGRLLGGAAIAIFAVTAIVTPFMAIAALASQPTANAPPSGALISAIVLAVGLISAAGIITIAEIASTDPRRATSASRIGRFNYFLNIQATRAFVRNHLDNAVGRSNGASARGRLRSALMAGIALAVVAGLLMSAAMAMGWSTLSTFAFGLVIVAAIATFIIWPGGAVAMTRMIHDTHWFRSSAQSAVTNGYSSATRPVSFLARARDKVDVTVATIAGSASPSAIRALGEKFPGAGTQLSAAA